MDKELFDKISRRISGVARWHSDSETARLLGFEDPAQIGLYRKGWEQAEEQGLVLEVPSACRPLPMANLRPLLAKLRDAYPTVIWNHEAGRVQEVYLSGDPVENWSLAVKSYNRVALEAAEALYEDTKDRNDRGSILMGFGSPDSTGMLPGPWKFEKFCSKAT